MYEIFQELLEKQGLKAVDVVRATGIPQSTFSDWKSGKSKPKLEKLEKIAKCLGTTVEYLRTGEKSSEGNDYYLNDYTRELAQFAFENPDYKVLFDASRKTTPKDFELILKMMERVNGDD